MERWGDSGELCELCVEISVSLGGELGLSMFMFAHVNGMVSQKRPSQ